MPKPSPDARINHPRSKTPKQTRVTNELIKRIRRTEIYNEMTSVLIENRGWQATIIFQESAEVMPLLFDVVKHVSVVMRDLGSITVLDVHGHTKLSENGARYHQIRVLIKLHKEHPHKDGRKN